MLYVTVCQRARGHRTPWGGAVDVGVEFHSTRMRCPRASTRAGVPKTVVVAVVCSPEHDSRRVHAWRWLRAACGLEHAVATPRPQASGPAVSARRWPSPCPEHLGGVQAYSEPRSGHGDPGERMDRQLVEDINTWCTAYLTTTEMRAVRGATTAITFTRSGSQQRRRPRRGTSSLPTPCGSTSTKCFCGRECNTVHFPSRTWQDASLRDHLDCGLEGPQIETR